MSQRFVILLVVTYFFHVTSASYTPDHHDTIEVILQGSSGDLAKRYLWKSLYQMKFTHGKSLKIFAASIKGILDIPKLLQESVGPIPNEKREAFISIVTSVTLSKSGDYQELCHKMLNLSAKRHFFYLSVPPFAYTQIANFIHVNCQSIVNTRSLRIVLEKPFGHDLASAREMAEKFSLWLQDEQIYRVDHFLGKVIVRNILPFRQANLHLERRWNSQSIDKLEIALLEELGVEGRLEYYDQYGAMRDMLQNHATEILLRLLQDLDAQRPDEVLLSDAIHLAEVPRVGRYNGYGGQDRTDTFAQVHLGVTTPRWNGVRMSLTSGKRLERKVSVARVVFKDSAEVIDFVIDQQQSPKCAILCSKSLHCNPPEGFSLNTESPDHDVLLLSSATADPYENVLLDLLEERRESFVSLPHLLASWRLWNRVLKWSEAVVVQEYPPGSAGPEITSEVNIPSVVHSKILLHGVELPLVRGSSVSLGWAMAQEIWSEVTATSDTSVYHLALPGGQSPEHLLQALLFRPTSGHLDQSQMWSRVHLWQVDERCCHPEEGEAALQACNQHSLSSLLLHHVENWSHNQQHLVPLKGECHHRCQEYGDLWRRYVPLHQGRLDHVVLGVGADGHVASLFSLEDAENSEGDDIVCVDLGKPEMGALNQRTSLSWSIVLAAKRVSLLLVGEGKREIVEKLFHASGSKDVALVRSLLQRHPRVTLFVEETLLPPLEKQTVSPAKTEL